MRRELTWCSIQKLRSAGLLPDIIEKFRCDRAGLRVPTHDSSYFAGCWWCSRGKLGVLRLDGEVWSGPSHPWLVVLRSPAKFLVRTTLHQLRLVVAPHRYRCGPYGSRLRQLDCSCCVSGLRVVLRQEKICVCLVWSSGFLAGSLLLDGVFQV
jgi:hypothetical protein